MTDFETKSKAIGNRQWAIGASPARAATPSPELLAVLAEQRANPPSLFQQRCRDVAIREAMRNTRTGRETARQRALERMDPSALANNARRLRALQRAHETQVEAAP